MTIQLTLVYSSAARQVREIALELPAGSTLAQALEQAQRLWLSGCPQGTKGPVANLADLDNRANVADAAYKLGEDWPFAAVAAAEFGLWGRAATATTVLHDGDRIEIYRPLRVDPKVARRERYRQRNTKPVVKPDQAPIRGLA